MRIHHIGYLVKNIDKAQRFFLELGYEIKCNKIYDEYRKINILFLSKDGYEIELVSSASPDSVVANLYKHVKNSPYHICYETKNFEQKLKHLTDNGYVQIGNPCVAPALNNKKVVFLMNSNIGMIELLES